MTVENAEGTLGETNAPDSNPDSTQTGKPVFLSTKIRPRKIIALLLIATVVILFNAAFSSSQYFKLSPGPAPEITSMVTGEILDPSFGQSGKMFFTTVEVSETSWREYIWRHINPQPGISFIPRTDLGPGTPQQRNVAAEEQMEQSKKIAYLVAARKTGTGSAEGIGARILSVLPGSPAAQAGLTPGEVITKINASTITNAEGAVTAVSAQPEVKLTLQKDQTSREVDVTLNETQGTYSLGVQLDTEVSISQGPSLMVNTDGVGGPSAGLMFTLAFTDALTTGDLTGGKNLAGTGTMSTEGTVGPISGIDDKVIGASAAGADVFFSPASQADEAQKAVEDSNLDITVVSVDTYDAAITWLCANGGESLVCQ